MLFERAYSPVTFDYAVKQLYGEDCENPPVREISVTVRAQEAMARNIEATRALTPLSRPMADMLRGRWIFRPFDPPWTVQGCVVWQRGNSAAAVTAFTRAAARGPAQPPIRGAKR